MPCNYWKIKGRKRFFSESARSLKHEEKMKHFALEMNISGKRKCELLHINRSSLYYEKQGSVGAQDVEMMNEIRDIYEQYPFYGYRKIHMTLVRKGYVCNRKKVQRLMGLMNMRAVYPKPRTTVANKAHKIYPYLLKKSDITRPNYAWQIDITYIRIRGGFIYLIALIDVYSRKVMSWCVSTFLDTESCLQALEMALKQAVPEIINSDQGCQFTSEAWINALAQAMVQVSMDGKGRWVDNVYIERFWRSIKYELVFLREFNTVQEARASIDGYVKFYNEQRPHQSLNYKTPNEIYKEFNYEINQQREEGIEINMPISGCIENSQCFGKMLS